MIRYASMVAPTPESGQDRISILDQGSRRIIAITDGAGGRGGGAEAAETALSFISREMARINSQVDCVAILHKADAAVAATPAAGETAAVVVAGARGLFGASVGDSGAWAVNNGVIDDLTLGQTRKPFLGTGAAQPFGFMRNSFDETRRRVSVGLN